MDHQPKEEPEDYHHPPIRRRVITITTGPVVRTEEGNGPITDAEDSSGSRQSSPKYRPSSPVDVIRAPANLPEVTRYSSPPTSDDSDSENDDGRPPSVILLETGTAPAGEVKRRKPPRRVVVAPGCVKWMDGWPYPRDSDDEPSDPFPGAALPDDTARGADINLPANNKPARQPTPHPDGDFNDDESDPDRWDSEEEEEEEPGEDRNRAMEALRRRIRQDRQDKRSLLRRDLAIRFEHEKHHLVKRFRLERRKIDEDYPEEDGVTGWPPDIE